MTTHDILVVHAATTIFLAGVIWAVQLTIVRVLERDTADTWPRHAEIYRGVFRALFWPVVVIEGGSGALVTLARPAGIPGWLHATNVTLLLCVWITIPMARILIGHHPLDRFDPHGFRRFARLNWIRVAVWTLRCGVVLTMIRLAHAAARTG
jgi:hypothetical protein